MLNRYPLLFCVFAMVAIIGCEPASDIEAVSDDAANTTSTATTTATAPDGTTTTTTTVQDGFDWAAIQWGGEAYSDATTVDMVISSATVSGNYINFVYTMNDSWPTSEGAQGIACAFKQNSDGSWYGGKFDWIRTGGQSVKGTENIEGGYGAWSGHQPVAGQNMAFAWVSLDGKRRSNVAYSTWQ